MNCKNCSRDIDTKMKYCPYCGTENIETINEENKNSNRKQRQDEHINYSNKGYYGNRNRKSNNKRDLTIAFSIIIGFFILYFAAIIFFTTLGNIVSNKANGYRYHRNYDNEYNNNEYDDSYDSEDLDYNETDMNKAQKIILENENYEKLDTELADLFFYKKEDILYTDRDNYNSKKDNESSNLNSATYLSNVTKLVGEVNKEYYTLSNDDFEFKIYGENETGEDHRGLITISYDSENYDEKGEVNNRGIEDFSNSFPGDKYDNKEDALEALKGFNYSYLISEENFLDKVTEEEFVDNLKYVKVHSTEKNKYYMVYLGESDTFYSEIHILVEKI